MSEVEMERQAEAPEISQTPEQMNHAEVLQELFTASDEVIASCRPKLWSAAERVAGSVIHPDQQRAIAVYAGVLDWHWFGKPNDPLPEGMIITNRGGDWEDLSLDYRIPYINHDLGHLEAQLKRVGMHEATQPYVDEMMGRMPAVEAVVKDFILNSSEYQLLASFDQPQSKPETGPLNSYWRQIREQQVEFSLRERYGYSPTDTIPLDSPLRHELRLKTHQLDMETKRQPLQQQGSRDALQRARAYLTPFVATEFEERSKPRYGEDVEFGDVIYDPGNGIYLRAKGSDDEGYLELWDYAQNAAWDAIDKTYTGSEDMSFVSAGFMAIAIEKILDPRASGSYSDVLQDAVEAAIEHIRYGLYELVGVDYSHLNFGRSRQETLMLRKPHGEVVDAEWMDREKSRTYRNGEEWMGMFRGVCELGTAAELYRDVNLPIGQVEKYGPDNYRVPGRLLQTQVRHEPVGARSGDEDLVINLNMRMEPNKVPYIPGYKLVSASAFMERYGFRVDPDGDPYQTCNAIVNQKRRQSLAEAYNSIGLSDLAEKIVSRSRLTVTELVNLIRGPSEYYIPEKLAGILDPDDAGPKRTTYIDSFNEFHNLVHNGKLRVQCSGAAHFVKQSLEIAFGPGCASMVGGQVIDSGNRNIAFAGHAQTVFMHKGQQYILDGTPPYNLSEDYGGAIPDSDYERPRHALSAPKLALADHSSSQPEVRSRRIEQTVQERVTDLINSLTERFKVVFNASNDKALYDYLVKLPSHDPARKTLELLLQYQDGKLDHAQVSEISEYIYSCAEASADLRNKAGFGHYTVDFLEQLRDTTWSLKWSIERAAEVSSDGEE